VSRKIEIGVNLSTPREKASTKQSANKINGEGPKCNNSEGGRKRVKGGVTFENRDVSAGRIRAIKKMAT